MNSLFALLNSPQEWLVILVVGVLLFGRRLPEVGRYLGKGIVEFKKGLKGIEEDVTQVDDQIDNSRGSRVLPHEQGRDDAKADHKFDPYTGKPIQAAKFDPYTGKPLEDSASESAEQHTPTSTT